MGSTHAVTGAGLFLGVTPFLLPDAGIPEVALGAAVAAGFSVLPDIDHPDATIVRRLGPLGRFLARGVEKISGGHRNGTHSLLAVALLAAALWLMVSSSPVWISAAAAFGVWIGVGLMARAVGGWVPLRVALPIGIAGGGAVYLGWVSPVVVAAAALIGYQAHLLGDGLTTQKVPLLWPFSKARHGLPLMDTGSTTETVLRIALLPAIVALVWLLYF